MANTIKAKSLVVFREFDAHLYQAHKDRNFIVHYNTSAIKGVDASLKNVRWLQEAMGLVEAEWCVEAFAGLVIGIDVKDWLFNAFAAEVDQTLVADCFADSLAMFFRVNANYI